MEHEPPPRDPESDARGHEMRDVAIRPILIFLIGLIVFGGVLQTIMSAIMTGYVAHDTARAVPETDYDLLRDPGSEAPLSPKPPLQRDTTGDMTRMYAEEDAVLHRKEPARDKRTGKVVVPIDRAIDIMAKKGLPHRDKAPKVDPDYTYSEKAKSFRATN